MNRQKWAILFGGPIVAGLLLFLLPSDRRFDESVFKRLKVGLTRTEVEQLIGEPPGDHSGHSVSPSHVIADIVKEGGIPYQDLLSLKDRDLLKWTDQGFPKDYHPIQEVSWLGRTWGISVAFDNEGRLIHWALLRMLPPPMPRDFPGLLRWLCR